MFKTAIILARGKRARPLDEPGRSPFGDRALIRQMVDALRPHFDDVILVAKDPERYFEIPDIRLVSDMQPSLGPMSGIFSGLLASRGRHNMIVSGDMPFLNPMLLDYLWSLRNWGDVVVPLTHEGLSPLLAIYDRQVVPLVAGALRRGQHDPMALYPRLRVHYVREDELLSYDPDLASFCRVSTPEAYQAAIEALEVASEEGP